jgi:hypothetical protein
VNGECKLLTRERGDVVAAEACSGERHHEHCQELAAFCPLRRWIERWERWGIPQRERRLLRDDLLGSKLLESRVAVRVMKARIAGQAMSLGGMKGSESIIVLAGRCGVGKTVAATWALSRTGGRYLNAAEFSRIGVDLSDLKRANTLVVDQLGMESIGESGWMLSQFLDVLDARYGAMRLTVLCCNLSRPTLEGRYGPIFVRRLKDDGVYFFIGDASL